MTVAEIMEKVQAIDDLYETYNRGGLNADHFEDMMDLLADYREELMNKRVVK